MIELTADAQSKVIEFMDSSGYKPEDVGLRIQVKPGGCAGFSYGLDIEPEPLDDDHIIHRGKITIFVDPFSAQYVEGTIIDWRATMNGSGFAFENPNSVGSCGCGESFQV